MKMKNLGNPLHHILKQRQVDRHAHAPKVKVEGQEVRFAVGEAPWWAAPVTLPVACIGAAMGTGGALKPWLPVLAAI